MKIKIDKRQFYFHQLFREIQEIMRAIQMVSQNTLGIKIALQNIGISEYSDELEKITKKFSKIVLELARFLNDERKAAGLEDEINYNSIKQIKRFKA